MTRQTKSSEAGVLVTELIPNTLNPATLSIDLSVVIPAYNEERRLPPTLIRLADFLTQRAGVCEIVVVDDGSSDGTSAVARAILGPMKIESQTITLPKNQGKGAAVSAGMLAAKGDRVLFMDADLAVQLEELDKAMALLDKGSDIAVASRALKGSTFGNKQSEARERLSKLFGLFQRKYLRLSVLDTQCGFKLFTAEAAKTIFENVRLRSVIFDGEVLWLAKRYGFRVAEFAVHWDHDLDSRIKYTPMKALRTLLDVLRIPLLHN